MNIRDEVKKAEDKIDRVMTIFFENDPIMLYTYCLLRKEADPTQETVGIDLRSKHPKFTYNPHFINKTHPEVLETILAGEGMRVLLRHVTSRLKDPREISHMSSSMSINSLMTQSIQRIISGVNVDEFLMSPEEFQLPRGEIHELYYNELMQNAQETVQKLQEMFPQKGDGEGDDQGSSGQGGGEGEEESKEGNGGEGGDQESPYGKPQQKFKEFDNQEDALNSYKNPMGTGAQGWETDEHFETDVNTFVNSAKNNAQGWGKYTGGIKMQILAANTPKISAKEILRRFAKNVISQNRITTRMKSNRRHDLALPGYRYTYTTNVMIGIDSSGSMSDSDIADGLAIVNSCLKHAAISVVMFDTEVQEDTYLENYKKKKKTFKVSGRGGTDFQEILDFADTKRVDGLVIFTDGMAPAPVKPRKLEVLWLTTASNYEPPVKWGYRAHISNRYEDSHW
jgi:predicted metal-dependent peptidase